MSHSPRDPSSDGDRAFWLMVRRLLLEVVNRIEARYGVKQARM